MTQQRHTTTPEYAELADIEWEAIRHRCTRCQAETGQQCVNPLTGKPYSRPLVHNERRKEVTK